MIWRVKNDRFQAAIEVNELGRATYEVSRKLVKCLTHLAKTSDDPGTQEALQQVPAMFQADINEKHERLQELQHKELHEIAWIEGPLPVLPRDRKAMQTHFIADHRTQLRRLIYLQEFFQQEYTKH